MQPCTNSVFQTGVCGSIPDGLSVYGIPGNSTALQLHKQLNISVTALVKPDLLTSLSSPCSGKQHSAAKLLYTLNLPCCAWRTQSCCAQELQNPCFTTPLSCLGPHPPRVLVTLTLPYSGSLCPRVVGPYS